MLTELGLLVRDGPKRATASLKSAYEPGEQFPAVGDLSVILDGAGVPLCVIRTTDVETRRFGDVDEEFAWTEAEGDRSLAHWRQAHIEFFASHGADVTDDDEVVLSGSSCSGLGRPELSPTPFGAVVQHLAHVGERAEVARACRG